MTSNPSTPSATPETKSGRRPRLEGLPSLRGFAAVPVVLFHQLGLLQIKSADTAPHWYRALIEFGHIGLEFFFILSGFVLAYVYAYPDRPFDTKRFWRARFARLYPAYLCSLVLLAPVYFWTESQEPTFSLSSMGFKAGLALLLLHSWVPSAALAWNFVGWSLSVEAFFYLLIPWLLPMLMRLSKRQLVVMSALLWAVPIVAGAIYSYFDPSGVHWRTADEVDFPWTHILRYNPLVNFPKFMLGMCAAILFVDRPREEREHQLATRLIAVGVALCAVGAIIRMHVHLAIVETGLLSPALALITYGFALQPRWAAPLRGPKMDFFGDLSFTVYLFHPVVLVAMFVGFEALRPLGLVVITLLYLVAVILLAISVHFVVERPAERKLRGAPPRPHS